jgi:hypothetical protein
VLTRQTRVRVQQGAMLLTVVLRAMLLTELLGVAETYGVASEGVAETYVSCLRHQTHASDMRHMPLPLAQTCGV